MVWFAEAGLSEIARENPLALWPLALIAIAVALFPVAVAISIYLIYRLFRNYKLNKEKVHEQESIL